MLSVNMPCMHSAAVAELLKELRDLGVYSISYSMASFCC